MNIKINQIHTEKSLNIFFNTPIKKFKSKTTNFNSLGYESIKTKQVILNNNLEYEIKTDFSIRELNKLVKKGFNTIKKINFVGVEK